MHKILILLPLFALAGCDDSQSDNGHYEMNKIQAGTNISTYVRSDPFNKCKILVSAYRGGDLAPFTATIDGCN